MHYLYRVFSVCECVWARKYVRACAFVFLFLFFLSLFIYLLFHKANFQILERLKHVNHWNKQMYLPAYSTIFSDICLSCGNLHLNSDGKIHYVTNNNQIHQKSLKWDNKNVILVRIVFVKCMHTFTTTFH